MLPLSPPLNVSVVIPIYNEEANVAELVARVGTAMLRTGKTFELICVDDGSRDGSAAALEAIAAERPWQAGFDAAQGEIIVTLDGDLQNEPDDIPELLKILDERPEVDVISGWRKERQDRTVSRKLPSAAANAVISSVTGVKLHDYGCALKLYRADVIRGLRLYGELHRFIPALAAEVGANIIEVPVRHHARTRGESKYGIDRTFRVLLDLLWIKFLMRFLHRPLQAFGGVGLALGLAGFLVLAWLTVEKLALGRDIGGRPLLFLGVLLALIGVQLVATGLIGELLTRIYHEPQGRPQYLLRRQPRKGS